MIIQIKIDIKHNHAMIKYFKSYIVVIILVNNFFFLRRDFGFAIIFYPQRICPCTFSYYGLRMCEIIRWVILVPYPIIA